MNGRHPYALMTWLADIRRERGMTLLDVAYRMGRSRKSTAHLGRVEAGDVDPRLSTVVDYAVAVGVRLTIESVDAGQVVDTIPGVPAEMVALVEQAWRGLVDRPPPGQTVDELWALVAERHTDMAAAYAELLDAMPAQAGLLRYLALDAREHRVRAASEARTELERARPVGDSDTGRAVDQ